MKNRQALTANQLSILGLMTALLLLMAYTPLGYLNIGPLAITLNMIPVAIAAIALGPLGGAITGTVFGLTSVGQCIGIGGLSQMGAVLFGINPVFAVIQRLIPRILMGFLVGVIFKVLRRSRVNRALACSLAGFFAAFLNTAFFMSALVLLFGNTPYMQEKMGGQNVILFICTFVGINAVFEMVFSTIATGVIGEAGFRARLLKEQEQKAPESQAAKA